MRAGSGLGQRSRRAQRGRGRLGGGGLVQLGLEAHWARQLGGGWLCHSVLVAVLDGCLAREQGEEARAMHISRKRDWLATTIGAPIGVPHPLGLAIAAASAATS